jgi:hypothetical protein
MKDLPSQAELVEGYVRLKRAIEDKVSERGYLFVGIGAHELLGNISGWPTAFSGTSTGLTTSA